MLRSMIRFSLRFSWLMVAVAAAVVALGVAQIGSAHRDLLPEFRPTVVEVQTEALGLSAYEVEQLITVPLEQDLLNGVAFLDHIESASLPGLSSVVMTFEPGTDVLDARQVVTERLTQAVAVAGLPHVADPPQMLQPLSSTSRVALVSMSSNELTQIQQSVLARWVIVPTLLGVDGVANVSIWGFRDRQLQVLVDPERIATERLDLADVIRTTGNALEVSPLTFLEASSPGTGGFIDTVNQRLHVFHEQTISTPEELAQVPIEDDEGAAIFRDDGTPLLLGEVTEITEDHQPLIGDARCNDGPCIILVVEKFPEANTPAVVAEVEETLESLAPGMQGLEMDTSIYRPADYISDTFSNLGLVLVVGAVLMLAALGLAFYDWRTTLAALLAIATSLGGAAVVLTFFDVTINTMVLAGVAMALVVIIDDSIAGVGLVSERIRQRRLEGDGASSGSTILGASLETRRPALFAVFIVIAVLIPFFFMQGEAGAFFPTIAWAYLAAVAVALIISLSVAPALARLLLSNRESTSEPGVVVRLKAAYARRREATSDKPGPAVITGVVLVALALVALPFMETAMRPALQERDVVVDLEGPPGMSLTRMDEITADLVDDLQGLSGIENIAAHVGRAIMSDQVVDVNSGQVWVSIAEDADRDATIEQISGIVDGYTEVTGSLTTYSEQRITEVLERTADEVVVRVYGEDDAVLASTAEDVRAAVAGVSGATDVAVRDVPDQDTIEIEVDIERAQELGLKPGDIRRTAATLLAGLVVGNLFEEQKVFDVVVWGDPALRETPEDVTNLPITTPRGEQIPLSEVADVRVVAAPTVIQHESVSKFLDVVATVDGRSIGDVASDITARVESVDFPPEFHWAVLGGFAEQEAANSAVLAVGITAIIGIYLLLQSAFASWRLATLATLVLPVALTGSILATLIFTREITLGTVAGIIAVLGLAARWVIALIRHYQDLERSGMEFGADLVTRGTLDRMVPLAASGAAIFAFSLPAVVMFGAVGLEIVGAVAIAVAGGVLTTLAMVFMILPLVYSRWGHVENPDRSAEDLYIDYELEREPV